MTTAQRKAIASPVAGMMVYDTTANVVMVYNGTRWTEAGGDPIGSIKAWHKSLTNTPALPWGWVECSGQTLADADSPYNGLVIPNLNSNTQDGSINSGMFLRGASTSGTFQSDGTAVNGLSASTNAWGGNGNGQVAAANQWNPNVATVTLSSTDPETRPANMTVVWILRVK
jgi:hypothetical protein